MGTLFTLPHAGLDSLPHRVRRVGVPRIAAFTLVELLVVMGIMVVLMALVGPAFNAIRGAGDFRQSTASVSGVLEQARAYAMANNTYVFVGFTEVDSSVPDSASPQIPLNGSSTKGGRVALAAVASRDGTRGYDVNNPGDGTSGSWVTNYSNYGGLTTNAANLIAISKLERFESLHFTVAFSPWTPANHPKSPMARPTPQSNSILGSTTASASSTPFTWPLGAPLTGGQYRFDRVINFDPQGIARIQYPGNNNTVPDFIEIDLQPAHGNVVPAAPSTQDSGNLAVLQIDGMTGAVRTYRP